MIQYHSIKGLIQSLPFFGVFTLTRYTYKKFQFSRLFSHVMLEGYYQISLGEDNC